MERLIFIGVCLFCYVLGMMTSNAYWKIKIKEVTDIINEIVQTLDTSLSKSREIELKMLSGEKVSDVDTK